MARAAQGLHTYRVAGMSLDTEVHLLYVTTFGGHDGPLR